MKVGGEYLSQKVTHRNFEKFAEDAGLARPLVRRRVVEMAEMIISGASQLEIQNPLAEGVAELIRSRAEKAVNRLHA